MQVNYLKNLTLILFLVLIISPSLFFYPFGSLSYGIIIFSFLLVSYTLPTQNNFFTSIYLNYFFKTYFILIWFIFLHFLITNLFFSNINYTRFFLSLVALLVFFLACTIFTSILIKIYRLNFFDKILKVIFYIVMFLCFLGIVRYSSYSPFYYDTNIYLTIFSEPSHLVISVFPFITYFILSSKNLKSKIKLVLIFLSISVLLKSATLMISIFLCFFLFFSSKQLLNLLFWILLIYFFNYISGLDNFLKPLIDFQYFYERFSLNPFGEKANLSVLVFYAGYHEIYLNLKNTLFLGIGFQQFGFLGEQSFIKDLIYAYSGTFEYSANKDSSFLSGKYISEFGLFGIVSIIFYFKLLFKNIINIKNAKTNNSLSLFFSACIISFFIELFIRGAGYFTVSSFLFIVSIIGQKLLTRYDKKN